MACTYTVPVPLSAPQTSPARPSVVSFASPVLAIGTDDDAGSTTAAGADGGFAFARVQGEICLVQISRPPVPKMPAPATIDLAVFRHELVSIFRHSHRVRIPARDVRVLEPLEPGWVHHEPESGTVFLAKDLALRLRRMSDASATMRAAGYGRPGYGQRRRS